MGSLTEEQLVQMVRDFIEFESEIVPTSNTILSDHNHKPRCLITLQEILWEVTDIEVEILEKILKYADEGTANLKKMEVVMKLRIDGYEASLCKTSCRMSSFDRPKGEYEYIEVMMMEENTRVIVDMDFRSQFELAKPTREYKELTEMLPLVFVGSEVKLRKIISVICSAAKKSLKDKGLHIPPWRKPTYMQSKWLSKDCKKISFIPNLDSNMG